MEAVLILGFGFLLVHISLFAILSNLKKKFKGEVRSTIKVLQLKEERLIKMSNELKEDKSELKESTDIMHKANVHNFGMLINNLLNISNQYKAIMTEAQVSGDPEKYDRCLLNISIINDQIESLEKVYFTLTGNYYTTEMQWMYKSKAN